jgi:hypothetical protein
VIFETVGDAVYAAFAEVPLAVRAATVARLAHHRQDCGRLPRVRVRMAVHGGSVETRDGHYFGVPLYRCARLMSTAHGGQVLLSKAAAEQLGAGVELLDLGLHRKKDLREPEHVYQLLHPELPAEFPPLRSTSGRPNNLPLELNRFFGRDDELAALRGLLRDPENRLVTLTGTGGSGKTRLALRAASELLMDFRDGVFLVDLVPVTDAGDIAAAAAAVLGIQKSAGRDAQFLPSSSLGREQLLDRPRARGAILRGSRSRGRELRASAGPMRRIRRSRKHPGLP